MNLAAIIEDLKTQVGYLEQRIKYLEQENSTLRQENERLGLNSQNSSLTPSRDLYQAKHKNRQKSPRNPGGQPGHKPQGYQLKTPDEVIDVFPHYCSCGHKLEISDHFRVEQKIEIPPINPYVTEYRLHEGYCSICHKKRTASLPEGVRADLLGDHAKTIVSALSGFFHNSKRDVQQILQDIFHLPISLGLVSMSEKRVSQKLIPFYKELRDTVEDSSYLHIDETGHKSQGKRGWG